MDKMLDASRSPTSSIGSPHKPFSARQFLTVGSCGELDGLDEQDADYSLAAFKSRPSAHRVMNETVEASVISAGGESIIDYTRFRKLKSEDRDMLVQAVNESSNIMDNLRLMEKIRNRFQTAGLRLPRIEVRFKNLKVERDVYTGSRTVPTLVNAACGALEVLTKKVGIVSSQKRVLVQLDNVSGAIKPGRMTLLMGPPGCGKTTLLRALAGQLKEKALRTSGDVRFNGKSTRDFCIERVATYIDQKDRHLAVQTVRETLAFSARCMGTGSRTGNQRYRRLLTKEEELGVRPDKTLAQLMHNVFDQTKGSNIMVELITRLLGLDACVDTIIGSEWVKGISGGQIRRVTSGEMLVNNFKVMLMDEISNGLDSSSTHLITAALRNIAHFLDVTVVVALLQPSPETYRLFDDVVLMSDGKIVFHGPREDILPFFETLHLVCPSFMAHADFLQEVTSPKDQGLYWSHASERHRPISAAGILAAFLTTEGGVEQLRAVDAPWTIAAEDIEDGVLPDKHHRYSLSRTQCLMACIAREWMLTQRNMAYVVVKMTQIVIMAFVTSTLFLRLGKNNISDGLLFMNVIFHSLLYFYLNGFSEIPLLVDSLPVFYKQRDYRFYPAWSYALASSVCRVPQNLLEALAWTAMVYWSCNFTARPGQFFILFLILTLTNFMSTALFRMLATITRNVTTANALGAVALLFTVNQCGFTISKPTIPSWWIWMYWANPMTYTMRALFINELTSSDWDKQVEYPPGSGQYIALGRATLDFRGCPDQFWWVWIGVLVAAGGIVGCIVGQAYFLTVMDELRTSSSSPEGLPEGDDAAAVRRVLPGVPTLDVELGSNSSHGVCSAANAAAAAVFTPISASNWSNERGSLGAQVVHLELDAGFTSTSSLSLPARTSALLFEPLVLAFKSIKYTVPRPGGQKGEQLQLLHNASGCFRPGVLTALMGASGAGKTTLMDVLAGRKTGGVTDGSIRVNGHPKDQSTFARVMGYVEQVDVHTPQATVHEALTFSAQMRLPRSMFKAQVNSFVDEVMDLIELHPIARSMIGQNGSGGLSTEQRKRLTIAVELVANPAVVFMDEPTSGLDARAAAMVMRAVRNTVNTGRTVVCTIHQPSLSIFQAFDELLLLKQGGQTIFYGAVGCNASTLISHFESVKSAARFQAGTNPASWMLDVSAPDNEAKLEVDFAQIYEESQLARTNEQLVDAAMLPSEGSQPLRFPTCYPQPWTTQLRLLLCKNLTSYWRNPLYNLVRFVITIIVALVFGTLFYKQGQKRDINGVLNIMGALFSSYIFMGTVNVVTILPIIAEDRMVFYRERSAGMYYASAFSAAQGLVEMPYQAVQSLLYVGIIYFMIGFAHDIGKFFWFLLFFWQCLIVFTSFGVMCINIMPDVVLGTVFCNFFLGCWNVFCGFFVQLPNIPAGWVWMYYATPITWILYGGIVTQLGDSHAVITNLNGVEQTTSQFVQEFYSYKYNMRGWCVLILFGFFFLFRAVSTIALMRFNFVKR